MTFNKTLAMLVVAATAVASSTIATNVTVAHAGMGYSAIDPILDADLLSLGGAPGTATMISNVSFDPIVDADILAHGVKPGGSTYVEDTAFDPILDADILALRGGYSAPSASQVQPRRAKSNN